MQLLRSSIPEFHKMVSPIKIKIIILQLSVRLRERPFNLKFCFFFPKNILIPNFAEKNILILVDEKKNNLIQFLSYNLMLNSGKKIFTLCATKIINILALVLSEKKILNETKNHNPPPSS